ncbi:AAA family ATPase [Pseudomonas aeruginosa]
MQIAKVKVEKFRGIESGIVTLSGHSVFLGDNNVGKSTLLEAIDLVLGPERLSRNPSSTSTTSTPGATWMKREIRFSFGLKLSSVTCPPSSSDTFVTTSSGGPPRKRRYS